MPERELIDRGRKALSDRNTVITSIGRGGNAYTFGAYDQAGQRVAVKVLHPELAVSVAADRVRARDAIRRAARPSAPRPVA